MIEDPITSYDSKFREMIKMWIYFFYSLESWHSKHKSSSFVPWIFKENSQSICLPESNDIACLVCAKFNNKYSLVIITISLTAITHTIRIMLFLDVIIVYQYSVYTHLLPAFFYLYTKFNFSICYLSCSAAYLRSIGVQKLAETADCFSWQRWIVALRGICEYEGT